MSRLGSTGRFHVGFAERGLKNWAKKPAATAQKRGGGVFEGQCAARIREKSMIDHALTQMESDDEDFIRTFFFSSLNSFLLLFRSDSFLGPWKSI
jgi:hypothetical protein